MTINTDLYNALDDFLHSNILSANRAIINLLQESAENQELCKYIEKNGGKVNFNKEFAASFFNKQGFNDNPEIVLPFIYSILYLIDSKKIPLENFLETAYPHTDIEASYLRFAFTAATALKSSFEKVEFGQPEIIEEEPEMSYSDMIAIIETVREFFTKTLPFSTAISLNTILDGLSEGVSQSNGEIVSSRFVELINAVRNNQIDENCLIYLQKGLQKLNLL